mgnify:CR=1 FL=1
MKLIIKSGGGKGRGSSGPAVSVLGVPFKHNYFGDMTVQLGAWRIRAMLEEKTVAWTEVELRQQVHWMSDDTEDGTVELHRLGLEGAR